MRSKRINYTYLTSLVNVMALMLLLPTFLKVRSHPRLVRSRPPLLNTNLVQARGITEATNNNNMVDFILIRGQINNPHAHQMTIGVLAAFRNLPMLDPTLRGPPHR